MISVPEPETETTTVYTYRLDPPLSSHAYGDTTYGIPRVDVVVRGGKVVDVRPIGHVISPKGKRYATSVDERRWIPDEDRAPFVADVEARLAVEPEPSLSRSEVVAMIDAASRDPRGDKALALSIMRWAEW